MSFNSAVGKESKVKKVGKEIKFVTKLQ